MPVRSPLDIESSAIRLTIKVNGSPVKDYFPVVSVHIVHEINRISTAEIIVMDESTGAENISTRNSSDFLPGNELEVLAGYEQNSQQSLFKGVIINHGLKLDSANGFKLIISCKHKAVVMTFNRQEAEYNDMKDSEIISEIIHKYNLECAIDDTEPRQEFTWQKSATDWDFILSRAGFYGFVTLLDGDKVEIGKPKFDEEPLLRLTAGASIISFKAELNAEKQPPSLSASAWDPDNQEIVTSEASEPAVNAQGDTDAKTLSGRLNQTKLSIASVAPMSQDQLKNWADGQLSMLRMKAIKGEVTFRGSIAIKTGGLIELEGVGDKFSGKAYVSYVSHAIEAGMWKTKVKFGFEYRPVYELPDFSYPPATGQLPAIHGLQIGIVEKVFSETPADKFKILIRTPSNTGNQNGMWARVSNFYATSGQGAFFLPEEGDEVIVGFLESDPRYPVVLGSLYSNSRKTAHELNDNHNYIKGFSTKGGLKITFDDKDKITTIETPSGNSIILNDHTKSIEMKDISNNTVVMNSERVFITSKKDINLKAGGNIKLDASGHLSLSAKSEVKIDGANITNQAEANFTAKGNNSAEISASGFTIVKGGIVTIN